MPDSLLLPSLGLCISSMLTIAGSRLVDGAARKLPLPLWFFVVSLTSPLVWIAFQALILVVLLSDPSAHAGIARQWPSYLRDVVLGIAWKLWMCGALCAAALAFFRRRSTDDPVGQAPAEYGLFLVGGAIAVAILVPAAMEYWIESGRLDGLFVLVCLGCAFVVGGSPVFVGSLALLRFGGAEAVRRYAEPILVLYAAAIICRGYVWYHAVAGRPGASAIFAVGTSALGGVCLGWFGIRRANRAAAAVFARSDVDTLRP